VNTRTCGRTEWSKVTLLTAITESTAKLRGALTRKVRCHLLRHAGSKVARRDQAGVSCRRFTKPAFKATWAITREVRRWDRGRAHASIQTRRMWLAGIMPSRRNVTIRCSATPPSSLQEPCTNFEFSYFCNDPNQSTPEASIPYFVRLPPPCTRVAETGAKKLKPAPLSLSRLAILTTSKNLAASLLAKGHVAQHCLLMLLGRTPSALRWARPG
jgi:hypothetical protein